MVATAASAAVQSSTQYAFGDVSTRSFTQSLYASTINVAGNAVIGKVVYGQDIDVSMIAADSLGTAVGEYVGTKVTETKIAQDAKTKLDGWLSPKKPAQPSARSTRGSQLPKTAANDDAYGNPLTDHDGVCSWNGQDPLADSSDPSQGQSSSDSQSQSPTSKRASQSQRSQNTAAQWNAQRGRTWANKGNPFGSLPGIIPGLFMPSQESKIPDFWQQLRADPNVGMTPNQFWLAETGLQLGESVGLAFSGFEGGLFASRVGAESAALDSRTIAAAHVREARNILKEAGLNAVRRNRILRSYDLETFRVEHVTEPKQIYRVFDDAEARMEGRFAAVHLPENQTDRIVKFALPNSSATRLALVNVPKGATIFTGKIAPQLEYASGLIGGAQQVFLTGSLDQYTFQEAMMPRDTLDIRGSSYGY